MYRIGFSYRHNQTEIGMGPCGQLEFALVNHRLEFLRHLTQFVTAGFAFLRYLGGLFGDLANLVDITVNFLCHAALFFCRCGDLMVHTRDNIDGGFNIV